MAIRDGYGGVGAGEAGALAEPAAPADAVCFDNHRTDTCALAHNRVMVVATYARRSAEAGGVLEWPVLLAAALARAVDHEVVPLLRGSEAVEVSDAGVRAPLAAEPLPAE